jgi:hypothetical protein
MHLRGRSIYIVKVGPFLIGGGKAPTVLRVGVGWDSRIVLLEEAPVRGVGFFSEGRKTHQRDGRTTFPPFERMIDSAIGCCWK